MQAILIYNPQAGNTSDLTPDDILNALRQAGFDPVYLPTTQEIELDTVLANAKGLVVVAGGDGSIRAVAIRLLGREARIAPLPMGTANNIARLLGLDAEPLKIIAGLADPMERNLDLGRVNTPQGQSYFLEAMGMGAFADILERYNVEDGKSVGRAVKTVLETLNGYEPKFFQIKGDGQDFSGSYFLCEVMNIPTVGFHYMLAPKAEPDDGLLDLVLFHGNQRENYIRFMTAVLTGTFENLPEVTIQRVHQMEIAWRGFPVHLDGGMLPGLNGREEKSETAEQEKMELLDASKLDLQVELLPQAVHFLIPKGTTMPKKNE